MPNLFLIWGICSMQIRSKAKPYQVFWRGFPIWCVQYAVSCDFCFSAYYLLHNWYSLAVYCVANLRKIFEKASDSLAKSKKKRSIWLRNRWYDSQIEEKMLDLAIVCSCPSPSFGGYEILLYFCFCCANVCMRFSWFKSSKRRYFGKICIILHTTLTTYEWENNHNNERYSSRAGRFYRNGEQSFEGQPSYQCCPEGTYTVVCQGA